MINDQWQAVANQAGVTQQWRRMTVLTVVWRGSSIGRR